MSDEIILYDMSTVPDDIKHKSSVKVIEVYKKWACGQKVKDYAK